MSETSEHKQVNYGAIFWILFVLTVLEMIVASLSLAKVVIVVALLSMAICKAVLVALFYMHLKFEKRIIYLIVAFPLLLATILTAMTLLDTAPV